MKYNHPLLRLALSLEFFAYSFPGILLVYYALIGADLLSNITPVLISAAAGFSVPIVSANIYRGYKLAAVFRALNDPGGVDGEILKRLKLRLLRWPRFEAISIPIRYLAGFGASLICMKQFGILDTRTLAVCVLAIVMVMPINMCLFFFKAEVSLARYLQNPAFSGIILPAGSYTPIGYFPRIFFMLGSILLIPLIMFNTFIFMISKNMVVLNNLALHIFFICTILLGAVAVSAWYFVKSTRTNLTNIKTSLDRIAGGELSLEYVPMISTDETGEMTVNINNLQRRLGDAVNRIQTYSGEITAAIREVAATSAAFAGNAQNQAASTEEISSTIEEMSEGIMSIAGNTANQKENLVSLISLMRNMTARLQIIGQKLGEYRNITKTISLDGKEGEHALTKMQEDMTAINKRSREMTAVTNVINDISDRINLLALNAAIEAARAGEAGRGFAVVADEIKLLADQTLSSISEIDTSIRKNREEIDKGVEGLRMTIMSIGRIIEGVKTISEGIEDLFSIMSEQLAMNEEINDWVGNVHSRAEEIKSSTEEQKAAAGEIVKSVSNVSNLTQTYAAGAEQMMITAENTTTLVEKLRESVDYFTLESAPVKTV